MNRAASRLVERVPFFYGWIVLGCVCLAGFADCDGDQTNGCEVALGVDAQNCGSCGNVCAPANAMHTSATRSAASRLPT